MLSSLLDEALDAWRDARSGILAEVEIVPAVRLEEHGVAGGRSVAELARHVMEVSGMMVDELCREDGDFRRVGWEELIGPHRAKAGRARTPEQIVAALRESLVEGERRFREAGEVRMLQAIRRFDGEFGTRLAWLHHGIAHEMYHRGQIAQLVRLMGIEPALTRAIRGGS